MTVTVSGVVTDVTSRKDSGQWEVRSPVYREGSSGEVVTTRIQPVRVVGGIFTAELEPGVVTIASPAGDEWVVTVPDVDADLWDLIQVAADVSPTTGADVLAAAVETYVENNPGYPWSGIADKPAVIAAGSTQSAAQDALGGTTVGKAVFAAGSTGAAQTALGGGATGRAVFAAATEDAAQGAMGGTATGKAVFTAGSTGAARSAIGVSEIGDAVVTAVSALAAREALLVPSDFDDRLSDTREPIDGSVSAEKLDAALAAFYELVVVAVTSPYFQALSNGNVLNCYTDSNSTQKVAKYGTTHYTNSEEAVYGLRIESNSGSTYVQVGGGSSTGNAATQVQFYTGATSTTLTGTLRGYFDSAGAFSIPNTTDQTTDYEKAVFRYNSNVLELGHLYGGSGTSGRAVKIGTAAAAAGGLSRYWQAQTTAPFLSAVWETTSVTGNMVGVGTGSTCSASSGNQTALAVNPTINQSSTAGYTALAVNVTESATGSGSKLLADLQVASATKFNVDNGGNTYGLKFTTAVTNRVTAASTTTLTSGSAGTQVFTGSTTQTCKLPTTNITAGQFYRIINQSTGDVTVQSSGANTIDTLTGASASAPIGHLYMALVDTPTTAAHWRAI